MSRWPGVETGSAADFASILLEHASNRPTSVKGELRT
jgi:hypothetical protein